MTAQNLNGLNISDLFPVRWLSVKDIEAAGNVFTINGISNEKMWVPGANEFQTKPVIWFLEVEKGLILNATNGRRIAEIYGDALEGWIGQRIGLFLQAGVYSPHDRKKVKAIRVRAEAPTSEQPQQPAPAPVAPPVAAAQPTPTPNPFTNVGDKSLRQRLHTVGRQVHGAEWEKVGPGLVLDYSDGKSQNSADLSPDQCHALIGRLLEDATRTA